MLRVLRSLIGIQEKAELPKRTSTLLHLRLAAVSSQPPAKPAMISPPKEDVMPIKQSTKPERKMKLSNAVLKSEERIFAPTAKISARNPSEASIQDTLNIAAIGSFWDQPRYGEKPPARENITHTHLIYDEEQNLHRHR